MLHTAGFRWCKGHWVLSSRAAQQSQKCWKSLIPNTNCCYYILLYMTAPRSETCLAEPPLTKTPQTKSFPHWESFSFTPQCLKTGLLLIPNSFLEAPTGSQFTATNNPSREAEHWLMKQLIKQKAASSGPITACLEEEEKLIEHRPAVRFKTTSYLHQGMSS